MKEIDFKLTETDEAEEKKIVKERMSKKQHKSGDLGPRNHRLMIMVPKPLRDDMHILTALTGVSASDVCNEALERFVKEHQEELDSVQDIRTQFLKY